MNSRDVIPAVEARKPFTVTDDFDGKCSVICESKPHWLTLVTFSTKVEAQKLADALNETFANHFDV